MVKLGTKRLTYLSYLLDIESYLSYHLVLEQRFLLCFICLFIVKVLVSYNMPSRSESANEKIKSCVVVFSALFLTLQIIVFVATIVFYLFASSFRYREEIARIFLTFFYPKLQREWLRGERALEVRGHPYTS